MSPFLSSDPSRVFNEEKTTQAASQFLKLAGNSVNYLVLIKFLYMLDRRALASWGRPVTGDEYYSMKHGPVLSQVLDLITAPSEQEATGPWANHISSASNFVVTLKESAGTDQLSEAEEDLIKEVFQEFGHFRFAPFPLADHLHNILPEWKRVTQGRVALPIADILKASHKGEAEILAINDELRALTDIHQFA